VTTDASPLLEAISLKKVYRGRPVVRDVNLRVFRGEIVGLLGPNGAGKTTTFMMLTGLTRPDAGRVLFQGEDVTRCPMHCRARMGMGYLPQESSVFRGLTVEQNLRLPLEARGVPQAEQARVVEALMADFDILPLRRKLGAVLSGGERRRVEMARALALSASILLLDEPFLGVDPITITEMKGLLATLRTRGLAVLLTDHNVYDALSLCDRAYILHDGAVLAHGSSHEIAQDAKVREHYLGDTFVLHQEERYGRQPLSRWEERT